MAIFRVWSSSPNNEKTYSRVSLIDTKINSLFEGLTDKSDIKRTYEAFWNISKLHPLVKVTKIIRLRKASGLSKGEIIESEKQVI